MLFLITFLIAQYASLDPCYDDPSLPNCANFTMDPMAAQMNVSMACMMNSVGMYMEGCAVNDICRGNNTEQSIKDSKYCQPFSELKSICKPMMGMKACWGYAHLCPSSNKTVVQQCQTPTIPYLPKDTVTLVTQICDSMFMPGCEKCINDQGKNVMCDYLMVYSDLCMSMPEMPQCGYHTAMCRAIPDWPICVSSTVKTPRMEMFFHLGMYDYILFQSWVPVNVLTYSISVAMVFLLAVFGEGLKLVREIVVDKLDKSVKSKPDEFIQINSMNEIQSNHSSRNYSIFHESIKSIIFGLELLIHYFLMLISMTFNVGLFIAIIAGAVIGNFIFSIVRKQLGLECGSGSAHHH